MCMLLVLLANIRLVCNKLARCKHSNLFSIFVTNKKSLEALIRAVNLIKLLWRKFTHNFTKLDHLINISNIFSIA
jgi:hypothetical protein